MDNKNLMPQQAQPVNRITTGQQQAELMELSEEALSLVADGSSLLPSAFTQGIPFCSYDGEDAE